MKRTIFAILIILLVPMFVHADIYKYQDENGVWHFTDTPPAERMQDIEVMVPSENGTARENGNREALFKEAGSVTGPAGATRCVVMIESGFGKGAGFFINERGYIVTNRHVVRGDKGRREKVQKTFDKYDHRLDEAAGKIQADEERLENYKKRIDRFRETVEDMEEGPARSRELEKYRAALADYKRKKRLLKQNRVSFRKQKRIYERKRSDYRTRITAAELDSTFKTTLKDGRTFYTYLVTVSRDLDLALLKLDDYRTPFLVPAESPGQGEAVYAIGSPLGLNDTVSKGIVSGFEKGFIKTDAKIYPGNSGGPLVTEQGHVVGVNTFKKITRKYEGLGFAIPIHAIMKDFPVTYSNRQSGSVD